MLTTREKPGWVDIGNMRPCQQCCQATEVMLDVVFAEGSFNRQSIRNSNLRCGMRIVFGKGTHHLIVHNGQGITLYMIKHMHIAVDHCSLPNIIAIKHRENGSYFDWTPLPV